MTQIDEKTAALNPSVPTDGGQLSHLNNESIPNQPEKINVSSERSEQELQNRYRAIRKKQDPNYLNTVSVDDLMNMSFTPRPAIIENLLYEGVYLFAGAPKIGKSFLVAQLAHHISVGEPLWDFTVHQSTVLYLALEDHYQRLQERIARMFDVDITGEFHLATTAKQLGSGLDGQLEYFLRTHENVKVILIDTLQKIRETTNDTYSYASDYEMIGQLKEFAEKHKLCILIVHHTRKQPSCDSFEMISGTTGLLGCADGAFLMYKEKRTDNRAILEVVGRDQPDQRIHLIRNEERLVWDFEQSDCALWKAPADPLLEKIALLVTPEHPKWEGTATELVSILGESYTVSGITRRLNINAANLLRDYHILFKKNERTRNSRGITLELQNRQA